MSLVTRWSGPPWVRMPGPSGIWAGNDSTHMRLYLLVGRQLVQPGRLDAAHSRALCEQDGPVWDVEMLPTSAWVCQVFTGQTLCLGLPGLYRSDPLPGFAF